MINAFFASQKLAKGKKVPKKKIAPKITFRKKNRNFSKLMNNSILEKEKRERAGLEAAAARAHV